MGDVAKIGLQVEARGVKQTFDELDKLAKSSGEVSKQMDKLVPLLDKFSKVEMGSQAAKIKAVAAEMSSFSIECNKMAQAVGTLRVSSTGLNDLKTVLSNLSKISTGGLSKHAENIQKLSLALSSGSALGNASTQITNLHTALTTLASTPATLSQIATAAGEFKGKSTSLNNFVVAVEKLAVVSAQLPRIALEIGTLAPALSNMSGVSAPVAALIAQLKALQGVMNATVSQANAASSQTAGAASRGPAAGGGNSGGFGVGTLVAASGVDASISGAFSAGKGAIQLADSMANLEARVKLVTGSSRELKDVQTQLFSEANNSRTSVVALTESYVALARSTKSLGISQKDIVDLSSKMSMAFKVGGGSAASFNSAMIQMNQGLSSGVLRGQEFNSMSEQAPVLLAALRKGLESTTGAIGLTEGQLRKMANAGKLTTDVVIPALQIGLRDIEKEFRSLPLTAEGGWTVMMNSVAKTLGELNKSTGVTNNIAESFVNLGKTLENNKDTLDSFASAIPLAALGALTLAITQSGVSVVRSVGSMATANIANTQATLASRTAEVERLAAVNAGIPAQQRSTASIMASMEALRLQTLAAREAAFAQTAMGRSLSATGGIFQAMGGWVTVAAVAITGIIYYWDELAASLGNVSAKASQAETALRRAMNLKDVGLISARQVELKASIGEQESELSNRQNALNESKKYPVKSAAMDLYVKSETASIEKLRLSIMELKASYSQANDAIKNISEEKTKVASKPRTAVDVLADQLQSSVSTRENKGKLALAMLAEQTKLANNMALSLEVRNAASARVKQLQEKSYEFNGKMYSLIDYEAATADVGKKPKVANPNKGLNSSQSRDATVDADYKAALEEQFLLQNRTADSLDKLTTAGKKSLQLEAQLVEAKSSGSKVGAATISSLERDLEISKKTAEIQEGNILTRRREAETLAEVNKTSEVLTRSLANTNEYLSARDELIRTGSVAEVVGADQKKLLAMRKAFMLEMAEIDRKIAANYNNPAMVSTLQERKEGLQKNLSRVGQQAPASENFDMKTVEGVTKAKEAQLKVTGQAFGREQGNIGEDVFGGAGLSTNEQYLASQEQYLSSLAMQKEREVEINRSADEKIRDIEKEKTTRMLSMVKSAESFANTMMEITSKEGADRLAKERENFKNQSGLYKAFYVMKQATAIAQATVAGTVAAAEMAAWGASMAGPAGAAAGQAIGYGMMAANIGIIAGQTIGMFAKGSAFDGRGIVDSPTAFSHGGGQGVMGEAGPEGILPLAKGANGKLGVQMYGGDKSNGSGVSKITIVNQTTGRIDSVEERQISPSEKQIIIKETIEAVNGNLANPNSSTSKAMANNYQGMRRNR